MGDTLDKRRNGNTLDFVAAGFQACWRNANDLVAASNLLIAKELHAPALSLAVLALEEIRKLCAIDGLLFARSDDSKSQVFAKSQRDHNIKLAALPALPILISNLGHIDPRRRQNEKRYAAALAISLSQLKGDGNAMFRLTGKEDFSDLNKHKQQGFYVAVDGGAFAAPRDAVNSTFSQAVYHFAWRAVSTLDFVLKDGNLERYIEKARSLRAKLSKNDHQAFEQAAQGLQDILFGA